MIYADTIDVAVRSALMAGPRFRYPWAHRDAAKAALEGLEDLGAWEPYIEFDLDLNPLDLVELVGVRPTIDARYVLARFGLHVMDDLEWLAS